MDNDSPRGLPKRGPFSTGRKWWCDRSTEGKASFWFIIEGRGTNYHGNPSGTHKVCRIEVCPEDLAAKRSGYLLHNSIDTFSHQHLKQAATLTPER